jgi:hypothetical protein
MTSTHHARRKLTDLCSYIGNFNHAGAEYLVKRIRVAIADHARVAVFAGENGEIAAYSWRHIDYDRHCRVHAHHLVGIYQAKEDGERFKLADLEAMEQDLVCHMAGLRGERKAA